MRNLSVFKDSVQHAKDKKWTFKSKSGNTLRSLFANQGRVTITNLIQENFQIKYMQL